MLRKILVPDVYPGGPGVFYVPLHREPSDLEFWVNWGKENGFNVHHPGRHGNIDLKLIYEYDVADADKCHVIISDQNPFRGTQSDPGGNFETGVAYKSGAIVLGHKEKQEDPVKRIGNVRQLPNGMWVDENNYFVETHADVNLMLSETIARCGKMFYGPRDVVAKQMAEYIKTHVVGHYLHEDRLIGRKILPPGTKEIAETITPGVRVDLTRWAPIINHPATRRMREVKQLGALFWQYPDATHVRYAHEVLSYKLTHDELQHFSFPPHLNRTVLAYALLHDHGHTPYSHELEEIVEFNQEEAALRLLDEPTFARAVTACDVDIALLKQFFNKKQPHPMRAIVSDKVLGTEKIAYLWRDGIATGKGGYDNVELLINSTVFENGTLGIDQENAVSALKQIELYQTTYMDTYFRQEARLSQRIFTLLGQIALEEGTLPADWQVRNDLWYDYFNILAEQGGHARLTKLGSKGIVNNAYNCVAALRLPGAEILEPPNGKYIGTIGIRDYTRFRKQVPARDLKALEERVCKELGVEPLDILIAPGGNLNKLRVDDTWVFPNGGGQPVRLLETMYPEKKKTLLHEAKRQAVSVRFFCRDESYAKVRADAEKLVATFKRLVAP